MKANAPEKIYLQKNTVTDFYGEFWPVWFNEKGKDSDIEYVRTDAFIEKTVNWLINNTDITPTGIRNYRKAMKGE